jgi:hypothetical protein
MLPQPLPQPSGDVPQPAGGSPFEAAAARLFDVRRAETAEDLRRVYAFRYDVYVREMNRPQHYADHASVTICEPLDETARVYLAETPDGNVVGTVRTNYSRDLNLGMYPELYRMQWALDALPGHTSISTKIIVARRFRTGLRSGLLSGALATATYRDALAAGIQLDFCDCSTPAIESFFRHLGYRRYDVDVSHPEYGVVRLLALILRDLPFLERATSPFAAILRAAADDPDLRQPAARAASAYRSHATLTGFLEE